MKNLFNVFLILSLVCFSPLQSQKKSPDLKSLDRYIEKALKDWDVPGLAIAIVKDDSVVFAKGYGVKTIGRNEPVDTHTLFAIASLSKAFTSASLGMLVEEGKLKWNDKVTNFVPYFQLYDPYATREMTVRDLLCHRSGLVTFGGDLIWYGTNYSRKEVIERIRFLKPKYSFRSAYGYQNIMFITAGEVLLNITGKTWDEFVKERIFNPLGMNETNTSVTSSFTNIATPHTEYNGKLITIPYRNVDNCGSAAAINSNVSDLSKWMKMWLSSDSGKSLISSPTKHEIWTPHTIIPVSEASMKNIPSRHFSSAALGWFAFDYQGKKILDHGGGMDGMISKICLVPEDNIGFVILTNSISGLSSALQYKILDLYLGGKDRDWCGERLKIVKEYKTKQLAADMKKQDERAKNTKPSLPLEQYTGLYGGPMYGNVKVDLENGNLLARFLPTASFVGDMRHWHYNTFEIELRDPNLPKGMVNFILDADGKVTEMKVDIPNPDFDFTELELKRLPGSK
ncbi:serine hydrolase [bacterium]|nr:MAG: serine hydrolase [bacterium]